MVGRAHVKYRCKGCAVTPRGCDLKKHYKTNVNWPLLKRLKAAELQELRDEADRHTLFIFDRGYSWENLPSYQTMLRPRKPLGTRWGRITSFFQVIVVRETVATLIGAVFVRISFWNCYLLC